MSDPLREKLAALADEPWSSWMRSRCAKALRIAGGVVLPEQFVLRWQRQMNTPDADLPEKEKESDRAEADRVLRLLRE